MKRLLLLVLAVILIGLAAGKAWAAPPAGDEAQGFGFVEMAVLWDYETVVGYGYGAGVRLSDALVLHVEGAPGGFAIGASYTAGDSLTVAAEYLHAAGYIYDYWGDLEYVEIDGFQVGVYLRMRGPFLWHGPYSDQDVYMFGGGLAVATDGYVAATGLFLEFKGAEYIGENVALTSGLALSGGVLSSSLGLMVEV